MSSLCRANQEKIRQRQSILPPPQGPAPIPIQHDGRGSAMNRNRVAPPSQHDPGTGSTRQVVGFPAPQKWPVVTLSCWSTGKPGGFSLCYRHTRGETCCCISTVLYKCLEISHSKHRRHLLLTHCSINQSSFKLLVTTLLGILKFPK